MAGNYKLAGGNLNRVYVIRMEPGCDVLLTLKKIAEEKNIKSGVILGGAASLTKAVLRNPRGFIKEFPINDKYRIETTIEGPLELLSISGNFSRDLEGNTVIHAHGTISAGMPDSVTYGGHMVEGSIIYTTGEFAIAEVLGMDLLRKYNEETKNIELYPENEQE